MNKLVNANIESAMKRFEEEKEALEAKVSEEKAVQDQLKKEKCEPLKLTVTTKVKANAVKREYEKQDELKRSVRPPRPSASANDKAPPSLSVALPESSRMYELLELNLLSAESDEKEFESTLDMMTKDFDENGKQYTVRKS